VASGQTTPTIFESFNARALEPAQVARTFVPSRHFEDLIKRRHTLVVGPRGSGKTTLLKMLQQPALEAWQHPSAEDYRSRIDFTGVFIPTDISWAVQLGSLGNGKLDPKTRQLISIATFTTHTLRSLVIAFQNRTAETAIHPFRRIPLSTDQEARIVTEVAKAWHVHSIVPGLDAIKRALSHRLSQLFELASIEVTLGPKGRDERLASFTYLHLHFLRAAAAAIEIFEDVAQTAGGKWALLYDELELAPRWIQEELAAALRSTDARFLFKLALNPFTQNDSLIHLDEEPVQADRPTPVVGQDFDEIALWYVGKVQSFEFCTQLWDEMLNQRGLPLKPPEKVLGDSYFRTNPGEWKEVYRPGSKVAQRFTELAGKDPSFAAYLDRKGVNPNHLDDLAENKKAATVRKIAPIVAVREFYRRPEIQNTPRGALRSRKTAVLYSGAESLFALTEGNPRWFIGIMDRLLDQQQAKSESRIPPPWQAEEARTAAERFQAMLATIPVPQSSSSMPRLGVLDTVEAVAEYFHEKIVRGPFKSDPPGTFYVDSQVNETILASLGRALNAGAIVYVPDRGPVILPSLADLRGKRFRISYLLAPLYGLPLRLGKPITLSTILAARNDQQESEVPNDQLSFLGDTEQ
jgi:hypothetical protein